MGRTASEVREVIRSLDAKVNELGADECKALREAVHKKYVKQGRTGWPIWEDLKEDVSVHAPEGESLRLLRDYVQDRHCVLLFNPPEREGFEFQNGSELVHVLEECPRLEFYVTDWQASFLVIVNHHDVVIAAGGAMDWLARIRASRATKN